MDWGAIIPQLHRFYGEIEGGWWELPIKFVKCYADMLPRLHSQESLDQLQLHWITSATDENDHSTQRDKEKAIEALQDIANGVTAEDKVTYRPQMSSEFQAQILAYSGIGYVDTDEEVQATPEQENQSTTLPSPIPFEVDQQQ